MSSFDYTDNFNGFNDLINRADFLTEMKIGKAHPSFKGLAGRIKDDPRSGGKGFPRDARMLIKTVLYNVDIFKEEDIKTLRASGVEASKDYREALEALLDKYEDEIKDKASDIADELEKQFESFVNDQALMVGAERKEMYLAKREAKAAADKLEKEIEGGGDIVDAVDDAVGELEQSTADAFETLRAAKEDPTTFIEIKIRDADKASDVSNIVTKYANEDGVEVSGNTVQFSVDPDTPLANAVSTHGVDKIEAALKRDVDAISDSVVVVMAPEEDYERMDDEEMGYGLDKPGGVPGSYAMGEEGGGITEVEDEESNIKLSLAGKEYFIGVDDPNDDGIITDIEKYQNGYMIYGGVFHDEQEFWDGEEPKEGYMYAIDFNGELMDEGDLVEAKAVEDNEDEAAARKKPGGSNVGDYPNVSKDDFCGPAGGAPEGSYPVNSERRARAALAYAHNAPDPEGIKNCVYRKAKKHGWFDKPDEEDNELDHFLTKEQPEDYIPSTDYEDVLDALVDDDKKKHAMKKLGSEDEEEAIKMQPMLESHKTNTSVYLTEQAASDKRNKKTETKNQSFKEKYKPKTSWQLEELRRYGL